MSYARRLTYGEKPSLSWLDNEVKLGETYVQWKRLKEKARGPDGLNRDIVGAADAHTWKHWFNLDADHLPQMLRQFRLTLIPKVDKPSSPGDYRQISVGSVAQKLYNMLNSRLSKVGTKLGRLDRRNRTIRHGEIGTVGDSGSGCSETAST